VRGCSQHYYTHDPVVGIIARLQHQLRHAKRYDTSLMDDPARNMVAGRTCSQCGTRADAGLIFCKKCGAVLRTPEPLIQSGFQDDSSLPNEMNRPSPLVFFSICAVVDFAFGYVKWHTLGSGVAAVFFGLPLTALLFLGLRHLGKGNG
jgi:hypothetical protein